MNYPVKILPNKSYKLIDCDISDLTLIRHIRVDENQEIINQDTNEIKEKYIADPTSNLADLSTNLLGIFKIDYLSIEFTDIGKKKYVKDGSIDHYCNANENIKAPIFKKDFVKVSARKYFTLNIGKLNNLKIPYLYNDKPYTAYCKVTHTPMKWNFWHFSVRWLSEHDSYIHENNRIKKAWAQRICSLARASLVKFAKVDNTEFVKINSKCYINEKACWVNKLRLSIDF